MYFRLIYSREIFKEITRRKFWRCSGNCQRENYYEIHFERSRCRLVK